MGETEFGEDLADEVDRWIAAWARLKSVPARVAWWNRYARAMRVSPSDFTVRMAADGWRLRQLRALRNAARTGDMRPLLALYLHSVDTGRPMTARLRKKLDVAFAAAVRKGQLPASLVLETGKADANRARQVLIAVQIEELIRQGQPTTSAVKRVAELAGRDERSVYRYWKEHSARAAAIVAAREARDSFVRGGAQLLLDIGVPLDEQRLQRTFKALDAGRSRHLDDLPPLTVARDSTDN